MIIESGAAGTGVPEASGQTPGSLGLDVTVDGNQIQKHTKWTATGRVLFRCWPLAKRTRPL